MIIWTIGSGGLLGSAIVRQATRHGMATFDGGPIPWAEPEAALRTITNAAIQFQERADGQDWGIVWAAGSVATASGQDEAEAELNLFEQAMRALADHLPHGRGAVFVASSAGGVYAGCAEPPFSEHTEPLPLSTYGRLKLDQERIAAEAFNDTCPVVIGRISNLYGPGQNLEKLQGLVSRLALSAVTRKPVTMFVSLDTIRDYIDVDDAATVALHWLAKAVKEQPQEPQIKIIASGQPVSLGTLIHLTQDISRTKFPVAIGNHDSAKAQARDLRLTPSEDGHVAPLIRTTLPAGVKRVYLDILDRHQRASAQR